jgi:thymidylate kinase
MFLVFEGIDGSGKSTLAKRLARQLNAEYVCTPPSEYASIRTTVHSEGSAITRLFYYLSSCSFVSDAIVRQPLINFVCDRYFFTSLADCRSFDGLSEGDFTFLRSFLTQRCLQPDHVFYCTCDREQRIERIAERRPTISDNISINFEARMLQSYDDVLPVNTTRIDTTNQNAETLTESLLAELKELELV